MEKSRISICHITTIHPRYDIRIFYKECVSLSLLYQVNLIVADGKGDEVKDGINIIDIGRYNKNRIIRAFVTSYRLYKRSLNVDSEIYHFHDSDFLFFGYKLLLKGKKVVYDAHEDLPRQIMGKSYITPISKYVISHISEILENFFSKKYSCIITATPTIRERFEKLNPLVVDICNFPSATEFAHPKKLSEKKNLICYIGGISLVRGIMELLEALNGIKYEYELELVGSVETTKISELIKSRREFQNINLWGIVDRLKIKEILYESKIGIVALHPVPNHINSLPVKMFEYMAAGLPVIASDFPLWRLIVEGNKCGICVEPMNPGNISAAINYLIENDDIANEMGENGRRAVIEKFNWENEMVKLLTIYKTLLV